MPFGRGKEIYAMQNKTIKHWLIISTTMFSTHIPNCLTKRRDARTEDSNYAGVAVGFHPVLVAAAVGFDHRICCSGSRPDLVHSVERPSGSGLVPCRLAVGYPVVAVAVVSFRRALSDTERYASWVGDGTKLPFDSWPTR